MASKRRLRRAEARRGARARASACAGKNRYATRLEADRVRRHQERASDARGLGVYECGHCGWWHLGHASPPPEKRGKPRRLEDLY